MYCTKLLYKGKIKLLQLSNVLYMVMQQDDGDATRKIPKYIYDFGKIYNYGMFAANMRDNEKGIEGRYFTLSETMTSRHDKQT